MQRLVSLRCDYCEVAAAQIRHRSAILRDEDKERNDARADENQSQIARDVDAEPADATLQGLKALSAGVRDQVAALAAPAAASSSLAQGLLLASGGVGQLKGGIDNIINGDAAYDWPGTVALNDTKKGAPALASGGSWLE